jgi:CysZ protein
MVSAFTKALALLGERPFWRIIWHIVLMTIATIVGLYAVVWGVLTHVTLVDIGWLNTLIAVLGGVAVVVLTWLLFPAVVTLVVSCFLERMIVAVETRHYPDLPAPTPLSLWHSVWVALRFTSVMLLLNLLAVPLYLLLPGVNVIVFYGVNAYLLGREYFELVALRRLDPRTARRLRRSHQLQFFVAGLIITGLLTVPLLNLVAPLIAAAFMVHLVVELTGLYQPSGAPPMPSHSSRDGGVQGKTPAPRPP